MKNLILFFLTAILLSTCSENTKTVEHFDAVIGTVEAGKATLNNNEASISKAWSKSVAKDAKINLGFNDLKIEMKDSQYFLLGKDTHNQIAGRVDLVLDNGKLYELKTNDGGRSILCIGCDNGGCQPRKNEKGGFCTDCEGGKCSKASTLKVADPIIDIE